MTSHLIEVCIMHSGFHIYTIFENLVRWQNIQLHIPTFLHSLGNKAKRGTKLRYFLVSVCFILFPSHLSLFPLPPSPLQPHRSNILQANV